MTTRSGPGRCRRVSGIPGRLKVGSWFKRFKQACRLFGRSGGPSAFSKAALKGLRSPTRFGSAAGWPSAASQAATPGQRTRRSSIGVAETFESVPRTGFPRPETPVSSQQMTGFRPVAATSSIASSSRQADFSQSAARASIGKRYWRSRPSGSATA